MGHRGSGARQRSQLNIEQQNKEPQNPPQADHFDSPEADSAVQRGWSSDEVNLDWFSRGFWLLAIWALAI